MAMARKARPLTELYSPFKAIKWIASYFAIATHPIAKTMEIFSYSTQSPQQIKEEIPTILLGLLKLIKLFHHS
jgi:hypothetical protein